MQEGEWNESYAKAIGMFLNGNGIRGRDARGGRITDVNFVLYFNASAETVTFVLPPDEYAQGWEVVVDSTVTAPPPPASAAPRTPTATRAATTTQPPSTPQAPAALRAGDRLPVAGRSLVVLRATAEEEL